MTTPTWTNFANACESAKQEILLDVIAGVVPATCVSFSELHDYVDANGYGGAFEHGFRSEDTAFWDRIQSALDVWIKADGLRK